MNRSTSMEESKYVYLLHQRGLFRINVSSFDEHKELKLECVFYYDQTKKFCTDMALFSHRRNLFMIGGDSAETTTFYRLVPSRFKEFPVKNSECLDEADNVYGFHPVKWPRVVRAMNKIYVLPDSVDNFHFQWFDHAGNRFHGLPPPPFERWADNGVYSVSGALALRDFIYLFIKESCGSCARAFSFSTSGLNWREEERMVKEFKEEGIPLPHEHRGDVGLSAEFSDETRVMVALCDRMPTAYRVCLYPRGNLVPKSYRHLREVYIENGDSSEVCDVSRLLDLGGGKFCSVDYGPRAGLLVCVFKIDFALEHKIQISLYDRRESSQILASRKFREEHIPFVRETWFTDVCLASAPAMVSYSPSSPIYTPAETASYSPRSPSVPSNEKLSYGSQEYEVDNDSDGVYVDEEDMGVEQEHEQFEGSVGEKPPEKGEQDENPEHDPVALARSLASRFEMKGVDKTGDNALSRSFIRTQLKSIMYGLAMIDRADAASEQRIIQEAEYAAVEAKVKALELQLEASNKACSAAKAELEALEHEKIKLRETVKAQRKQLRAKDEELVSTRDKAIQEWRQSEEFRQAARSYAREDTDRRKKRCRSRD